MLSRPYVEETVQGWIDSKKVKYTSDKSSVFVRLLEDQRLGMIPDPAGPSTAGVVFPSYVGEKLQPVWPGKYCSPRHRMPFQVRNSNSKMRWIT
jgi:hypothetical protein